MAFTKINAAGIGSTELVTLHSLEVLNNATVGGVLTYEDVTNVDSIGLITARNGIVVGSGITLSKDGDIFATGITTVTDNVNIAADNKKLLIGASQDLELYHDGSHSFIENTGTGYLFLKDTGNLYVRTGDFRVQNAAGSETMLVGSAGGALSLNFAGSEKFSTSNTGIDVTGAITADDLRTDNSQTFYLTTANDFRFRHTGGTERLRIDSSGRLLVGSAAIQYAGSPLYASGTDPVVGSFHHSDGGTDDQARIALGALENNPPYNRGVYLTAENNGAGHDFLVACSASHSAGPTEKFRIDSSGNVMIGTTSSTVYDDSSGSGVVIRGATGAVDIMRNNDICLTLNRNTGDGQMLGFSRAGANKAYLGIRSNHLCFDTGASERLRITSTGQVNIGASSPTTSENGQLNVYITTSAGKAQIVHSAGTGGLRLAGTGGGSGSNLVFSNNYSSGTFSDHWTLTHNGGDDSFRFLSGGTGGTERARFTAAGYFLLGGTNTNFGQGNTAVGVGLNPLGRLNSSRDGAASLLLNRNDSDGAIAVFYRQGTQEGNITITTSAVAYNTSSSDRTLKKNFEDWTENTLDLFKSLKPQKFNFIHQEDSENKIKGYVAQDLVDSFPEAYPKDDDGKYQFNPSGMVVYLMKAIQELKAEVEQLK